VCAPSHRVRPFGRAFPMTPFTTRLIKQTDTQRDYGSSHRAPMVLENRSIPSDYASQHLPSLYTHKHPGQRSHSIHICKFSHSTLQQPNNMEPAKRIAASGTWDHLLEEIVNLIAIKVAETSEAPLDDLHSLWLCNKAMKRASSSCGVANCFNLNHHTGPQFGEMPPHSTHT
jgi:hypothetical protein